MTELAESKRRRATLNGSIFDFKWSNRLPVDKTKTQRVAEESRLGNRYQTFTELSFPGVGLQQQMIIHTFMVFCLIGCIFRASLWRTANR